jgi:hypothetical protein
VLIEEMIYLDIVELSLLHNYELLLAHVCLLESGKGAGEFRLTC